MATGDERTYFEDKRNLPQQRLKDTFFDYLEARLREVSSRVWGTQRGVFGSCSLIGSGNNEFDVSNLPKDFLDGDGNILTLDGTDGTDIVFANENAIDYHVAVKHCKIPKGVLRNPRNQVIFYDTEEDRIGEVDEPNSLSEVGGGLKIIIDTVFEATQRNDARLATVWLRRPVTIDESVAIERNVTVQWDGSNNYIQTAGLLGQGAGVASTNVADYQVAAQGVTVRKNTDLSVTFPYAYIGTVTGGGWGNPPSAFSVIGQIDVSDGINPDLQEAYTSGRIITPSSAYGGAVRIQSADSGDPMKSLLVLDRKGTTETSPLSLSLINERSDGTALAVMLPLIETGGALQEDEPGTTNASTGVVDLTRGAVNLNTGGIHVDADFVLMWDFSTSAMNRLYKLDSFTSNQITLTNLDGTAPGTWVGSEVGNVSFLRAVLASGESLSVDSMKAVNNALTITGGNNVGAPAAMRTYARNARASIEHMSKDGSTVHGSVTDHGTYDVKTTAAIANPGNRMINMNRMDDTSWAQFMMVAEMGDVSAIPIACIQPVSNSPLLEKFEACTLAVAGDTVTLTRGGPAPDLTNASLRINTKMHLAWIYDSADPSDDGIYPIISFTATTLDVENFDGTVVTFVGGAAKVRIMTPRFIVANSQPFSGSNSEWWYGMLITLQDGEGNSADMRILTEKGKITIYDHSLSGATYYDPRELLVIDPSLVAASPIDWPFNFKRSVLIAGGNVSGAAGEESGYSRDGLRIHNADGSFEDRDTAFGLVLDAGFPESIPSLHTLPSWCVSTGGAVGRGHHFRDDFIGHPTGLFTSLGPYYTNYPAGAGTAYIRDITDAAGFGHGAMELTTGAAANDIAEFGLDPIICNLDSNYDFRWTYRARIKVSSFTDMQFIHGFYRPSGVRRFYFIMNYAGDPVGSWRGAWVDPGPTTSYTSVICGASVGEYQWFEIHVADDTAYFTIDRKDHAVNSYGTQAGSITTLAAETDAVGINMWLKTTAVGAKAATLDYWEIWDREVLVGRHGTSHNLQHP
jgi:hypothetical protein